MQMIAKFSRSMGLKVANLSLTILIHSHQKPTKIQPSCLVCGQIRLQVSIDNTSILVFNSVFFTQ